MDNLGLYYEAKYNPNIDYILKLTSITQTRNLPFPLWFTASCIKFDLMSFPTYTPDADRQVLLRLPDETVSAACSSSSYLSSICNEEFWHDRYVAKYKRDLNKYGIFGYQYRDLYLSLNKMTIDEILLYAASNGYLPLMKYAIFIIDNETKDRRTNEKSAKRRRNLRAAAIDVAIEHEQMEIVKWWIVFEKGRIDAGVGYKAALVGSINVVKLILDYNKTDKALEAITKGAKHGQNWNIIEYLWKNEYISAKDALWFALKIKTIDFTVVEHLVPMVGPINDPLNDPFLQRRRKKMLKLACEIGRLDIVLFLIDHGAAVTKNGSELIPASKSGNVDLIHFLIENYLIRDGVYQSSLLAAITEGHYDAVVYLLENTRISLITINEGIIIAARKNHIKIVDLLIKYGADDYDRALQVAARYSNFEVMELLLDAGANIDSIKLSYLEEKTVKWLKNYRNSD